jgi:hypothetical protein
MMRGCQGRGEILKNDFLIFVANMGAFMKGDMQYGIAPLL